MEDRPRAMVAQLIFAFMFSTSLAWAESVPTAGQTADWAQRMEKASALKAQAKSIQTAAESLFTEQEKACYAKFMVNQCIDAAKKVRLPKIQKARELELEGKQIERAVRQEQFADREARHAEDARQREADLPRREQKTVAEHQQYEEKSAATLQKKEEQASEGARRRAEREARLAKKRADHEAKVAEKIRAADQ